MSEISFKKLLKYHFNYIHKRIKLYIYITNIIPDIFNPQIKKPVVSKTVVNHKQLSNYFSPNGKPYYI